jgi:DNA repair exonuclease SbcCD ATPase subunit
MIETAEFQVWKIDARRDDWHTRFVGSDIRQLIGEIERLTASNAANADHARLANANQESLRVANASLKARISELEANEKAYEEIIGKKTYREMADRIRELEGALESIRQFGSDTLSGRADGPDDREWQREAVREMTARASAATQPKDIAP